jgi:nitrite reductase/ring-hydroxylating ferredoxin subunit
LTRARSEREIRQRPDIHQAVKQQRRVFLKVLATGPFVACAGANPGDGSGAEAGAAGNNSGGSSTGSGGTASTQGGSTSTGGSSSTSTGGSPFTNGGNPFSTAGRFGDSPGGSSSGGATTSAGSGLGGSANPGEVVANVSSIALGSFQIVGGLFFMGRDAGGLWAMSLQCTHKFCAVVMSGNELDCPCHHSRFDRAGNVLQGPATTPLPRYKVYVDAAGNISVDKYTIVNAATRTPV